ncbi:vWA domain-containing protein [Aquimarina agarivorans]|uniref:vWA domain-containing protein n=1 Tax=Aquimarina agarivorans TaxID=980584 RepID=UPI000248EC38|nr:VWA domain-containing protein [Aquimarina agarivorans]
MFSKYTFESPAFFWLLLCIPAAIAWYVWRKNNQQASLKVGTIAGFKTSSDILSKLKPLLFAMQMLALASLIVALARPQNVDVSTQTKTTKGIDIAMAIDISGSMLAKDLKPNRLEALKKVAADFIKGRKSDRIGLVVYAGESFTKTPVTSDKTIVLSALNSLKFTQQLEGGTAIGMGLATAVNRLKESKAKSKVIILLTDGTNNAGFIDPSIAAELALEYGIKVYTIGVGTNGTALSPVAIRSDGSFQYGNVQVEIDEKLLKQIAKTTSGRYFRATNNKSLKQIYAEIDKLEKTDVEEIKFTKYEEKYRFFALFAFGLTALVFLLKQTLFKSFI